MRKLHERFVTDSNGRRTAVLLNVEEYEKLLQELEELESLKPTMRPSRRPTTSSRSNKPWRKLTSVDSVSLRCRYAERPEGIGPTAGRRL